MPAFDFEKFFASRADRMQGNRRRAETRQRQLHAAPEPGVFLRIELILFCYTCHRKTP